MMNFKCPNCNVSVNMTECVCHNCGASTIEYMIEQSLALACGSCPDDIVGKYFTNEFIKKVKGDNIVIPEPKTEDIILPINENSVNVEDQVMYKITRLHYKMNFAIESENFDEAERLKNQFVKIHQAILNFTDFKD